MKKEMTMDEMMDYINQNNLRDYMQAALFSNRHGFGIIPSKGTVRIQEDGVHYIMKTIDGGDTDLSFMNQQAFASLDEDEKQNILNTIKDPDHATIDVIKENEAYTLIIIYQSNSTSAMRREEALNLEIREFLAFTGTHNTIGIRSLIQQSQEIMQNWTMKESHHE